MGNILNAGSTVSLTTHPALVASVREIPVSCLPYVILSTILVDFGHRYGYGKHGKRYGTA